MLDTVCASSCSSGMSYLLRTVVRSSPGARSASLARFRTLLASACFIGLPDIGAIVPWWDQSPTLTWGCLSQMYLQGFSMPSALYRGWFGGRGRFGTQPLLLFCLFLLGSRIQNMFIVTSLHNDFKHRGDSHNWDWLAMHTVFFLGGEAKQSFLHPRGAGNNMILRYLVPPREYRVDRIHHILCQGTNWRRPASE